MSGSEEALPGASGLGIDWLEVGEPPDSVSVPLAASRKRYFDWVTRVGAIVFGTVVGYVVLQQIAPGFPGWPPGGRVEIWIGVGVPAGAVDFFLTRWYFALAQRAMRLHIRRLSISGGELHLEPVVGPAYSVSMKRVLITKPSVGEGWFQVTISRGRYSPSFPVPGSVAALIASELARGRKS